MQRVWVAAVTQKGVDASVNVYLDSYEEDVETLRSWIVTRTEKIDAHMSTDFRQRTVDPPSYDD